MSLRRKLEDEGAIFHSNSDTEVLMHLIRRSNAPTFMDKLKEALNKVHAVLLRCIRRNLEDFA